MPTRADMRSGASPTATRPHPGPPWQFLLRASLVITGLTLLLIVDVRGVMFYLAWTLIVLALASEATAMAVYWRRQRQR